MRLKERHVLLWLLVSLASGHVLASDTHADNDNEHAGDAPSSRLIWHMMDLRPYIPPEELPHGNGVSETQMTGRILAAAGSMLNSWRLSNDFRAVIQSAKIDNGWSIDGEGDDWNSDSAINSWQFPDIPRSINDDLKHDTGWVDKKDKYCGEADCTAVGAKILGDARVQIYSNAERIIVAFEGTGTHVVDILHDLNLGKGKFHTVDFHLGILNYYKILRDDVHYWLTKFNAKNKHVYFTGHSLGGAAATIAIYDYAFRSHSEEIRFLPTLHTIGAPAVVHCSRPKRTIVGPIWVYDRCNPIVDSNVEQYESKTTIRTVDADGNVKYSPLRRHLHYWANVRDPAPFAYTPKKDSSRPYHPQFSHVGVIHEMHLGKEDIYDPPDPLNLFPPSPPAWSIITHRGPAWSKYPSGKTAQYLVEKQRLGIISALTTYHDPDFYAEGLERVTGEAKRWFTIYDCVDNEGTYVFCSLFHQDAFGNGGSYHADLHGPSGATSSTSSLSTTSESSGGAGSISPLMLLLLATGLLYFRQGHSIKHESTQ